MPRTSFELVPEKLRWYREALGLSQREVGLRLKDLGEGACDDAIAAATNSYSRLENTGKTLPRRAEKLAEILEVPLELLQESSSKRREIGHGQLFTSLYRALKSIKSNPEMAQKLSAASEKGLYSPWEWVPEELLINDPDVVALKIATVLERFSLTRSNGERDKLCELLSLSEEEITHSAYVDGVWLAYAPCLDSNTVGVVISGLVELLSHLKEVLRRFASRPAVRACISNQGNCLRIEFKYDFPHQDFWIELSQCATSLDRDGLRYTSPSPNNREFLLRELRHLLQKYAWAVEGENVPAAPRPETLAFRICSKALVESIEPSIRFVNGCNLDNMEKDQRSPRIDGGLGDEHVWHVTCNLVPCLIKSLSKLIVEGGTWEVLSLPGDIMLEEKSSDGLCVTYHRIELVTVVNNHCVETVAWPETAISEVKNEINKLLADNKRGSNR